MRKMLIADFQRESRVILRCYPLLPKSCKVFIANILYLYSKVQTIHSNRLRAKVFHSIGLCAEDSSLDDSGKLLPFLRSI